jgi:Xaa-Pro aminopeptidase
MAKVTFLSADEIKTNIKNLQNFLGKSKVDAIYLSSGDIFLNEYVPLEDCHRYYVTNFTGSTAEVLVPKSGKVCLFVDGRYFEQADLEVDPNLVEVVKVDMNTGLRQALINKISLLKVKVLALEGDRTDLNLASLFESKTKVHFFHHAEVSTVIPFKALSFNKRIIEVDKSLTGETTLERLHRILKPGEAFYVSALDSIAWLTNLRRYELPNQSTFRAKALATYDRVYLLLEHLEGEIKNPAVEAFVGSFSNLNDFLSNIQLVNKLVDGVETKLEKIYYSDASINASDYFELKKFFGEEKLNNIREGLIPFHANKNETEINSIKKSFDSADRAIYKTIEWTKAQVQNNADFSELDYYHKCDEFYREEGANDQSFKTIAAFGSNSSIIHFSSPSEKIKFKANELALLDSGGFFESGYATDTTRTFLSGGKASDKQKEIYTLVLKSLLHALNAVFVDGAFGSTIDGVTRQPMLKYGHNFNHGTGHGVGINVHEGGFRISPNSVVPLKENTVGSLEPGIYLPGFGGVRLENIVIVRRHPTFSNMLCFENLVWVGLDHDLINEKLLSEEEMVWLEHYERECERRGRSFKYKK